MQFAQTLERLLYIRAKEEKWVEKGWVEFPPNYRGLKDEPNFYALINAWGKLPNLNPESKWVVLLHRIREQRNDIVHNAIPLTAQQIKAIWSNKGLFVVSWTRNVTNDSLQLMNETLKAVCAPSWTIPDKPLVRSLYQWGLDLLQSEASA